MGKLLTLETSSLAHCAVINEFHDLCILHDAFAPTERRLEQVRSEIQSWYAEAAPNLTYTEKTDRVQLDVGMCAKKSTIDVRAAYKKLGLAKFLKAASLSLKALAAYLTEPEVDALTSTARTGARTFATTPITRPALPDALAVSDELLANVA